MHKDLMHLVLIALLLYFWWFLLECLKRICATAHVVFDIVALIIRFYLSSWFLNMWLNLFSLSSKRIFHEDLFFFLLINWNSIAIFTSSDDLMLVNRDLFSVCIILFLVFTTSNACFFASQLVVNQLLRVFTHITDLNRNFTWNLLKKVFLWLILRIELGLRLLLRFSVFISFLFLFVFTKNFSDFMRQNQHNTWYCNLLWIV